MSSSADSAARSLRVIVGPTAAGKSALALTLAAAHGGGIVSADSRQVYRGFDIGTGKPTPEERARVPHWGIDVADGAERWSAARFAREANVWLREAEGAGHTPVVVGGTGLWVRALVTPFAPIPELDPARRTELAGQMARMDDDELRRWCAALDPDVARLGPAQWRRGIEVSLLTGKRLSAWQRDGHAASPPRTVRYLVLDPGAALESLIAARVDAMYSAGWAAEVHALMGTVPPEAIAWKACGYARLRDALEAGRDPAAVRDAIVTETRQYAKRQRTWFRQQLTQGPVTRLDPLARDAAERAHAWSNGADIQ